MDNYYWRNSDIRMKIQLIDHIIWYRTLWFPNNLKYLLIDTNQNKWLVNGVWGVIVSIYNWYIDIYMICRFVSYESGMLNTHSVRPWGRPVCLPDWVQTNFFVMFKNVWNMKQNHFQPCVQILIPKMWGWNVCISKACISSIRTSGSKMQ